MNKEVGKLLYEISKTTNYIIEQIGSKFIFLVSWFIMFIFFSSAIDYYPNNIKSFVTSTTIGFLGFLMLLSYILILSRDAIGKVYEKGFVPMPKPIKDIFRLKERVIFYDEISKVIIYGKKNIGKTYYFDFFLKNGELLRCYTNLSIDEKGNYGIELLKALKECYKGEIEDKRSEFF